MWTSDKKERGSHINARDFVELLDELIKARSTEALPDPERIELLKRELTDYLLATDPRKGIYVTGDHP